MPLGDGQLCLRAPLGRFQQQTLPSSATGTAAIAVDTTQLPLDQPLAMANETLYFQAWFREPGGSSNLSNALSVTVQP